MFQKKQDGAMNKYENLGVVGEGSYGVVMKCRHKSSGEMVAVKKFLETDDDQLIKKIALREINLLRKLRHENLVNLIEVFRRKKHLYLVLEYVSHTILDVLEQHPKGLGESTSREYIWQIFRGLSFCHSHQIIHRDVKPENVLVSDMGVIKLCDFGFARMLAAVDESCTDYVATRWYRAPELLVGDTHYGKEVDVWAAGCLLAELLTGNPLFPGESDIDQIFWIVRCLGKLAPKHQHIMATNPMFDGIKFPPEPIIPFTEKFSMLSKFTLNFLQECLRIDPEDRSSTTILLDHPYFTWDFFTDRFWPELQKKLLVEFSGKLIYKPTKVKIKSGMHRQQNSGVKEELNEPLSGHKAETPTDNHYGQSLPPFHLSVPRVAQPPKPPTKIAPLTPSHLDKAWVNQDMHTESKDFSMPPIGHGVPNKTSHELKKLSSPHFLHNKIRESDVTANQSPFWLLNEQYRKQMPIGRKSEVSMEFSRQSSSSPIHDPGSVVGEQSLFHARSLLAPNAKKLSLPTATPLKHQKENSALPNIQSPVGPLSPLKSRLYSQTRLSAKTIMPSISSFDSLFDDHFDSHK